MSRIRSIGGRAGRHTWTGQDESVLQEAPIHDDKDSIAGSNPAPKRPRLLFVVHDDRFFCSHRLPVARAALRDGYEVVVAARIGNYGQRIRDEGFQLISWQVIKESYNPFKELRAVLQMRRIYRHVMPDIAHHIALKPILYGSLGVLGLQKVQVIDAFTGLGYLAAASTLKARLLRLALWPPLKILLNRANHHVLLQNHDDQMTLINELHVTRGNFTIIRGSGVNVDVFRPAPEPGGAPIVLLASRMLWIKGVEEFVEAARWLHKNACQVRFVLAGDSDAENPATVPRRKLLAWQASGAVEWWGHQHEMPRLLQQATVVCLPSHGGEGVPKVLLEAAASGRAIVATDVPGCRDIVRHGVNGILVQPRRANELAQAIERLLKDPVLRKQMANRGREIAVREFSEEVVVAQTLALYRQLLGPRSPGPDAHAGSSAQLERAEL